MPLFGTRCRSAGVVSRDLPTSGHAAGTGRGAMSWQPGRGLPVGRCSRRFGTSPSAGRIAAARISECTAAVIATTPSRLPSTRLQPASSARARSSTLIRSVIGSRAIALASDATGSSEVFALRAISSLSTFAFGNHLPPDDAGRRHDGLREVCRAAGDIIRGRAKLSPAGTKLLPKLRDWYCCVPVGLRRRGSRSPGQRASFTATWLVDHHSVSG